MFATTTRSASIAFTGNNQVVKSVVQMESPAQNTFKRLYLGWAAYDAGDLVVEGTLRFKYMGAVVHQERFLWMSGPPPSGYDQNAAEAFVPPFSVNRIVYAAGVSNVQPVSAPIGPDARVFSVHYTDNAAASFAAQVTCQPIRFPLKSNVLEIEIEGVSGTIAGLGVLILFAKLDSAVLPL